MAYTADSGILPKKKTTYPSYSYPTYAYSPSTQYTSNITETVPKTTTPKFTAPASNYSQATLDMQKKLKAAGFDPGPLDGIIGPQTKAAQDAYNKAQTKPVNSYNPQTGVDIYNGQTTTKVLPDSGIPQPDSSKPGVGGGINYETNKGTNPDVEQYAALMSAYMNMFNPALVNAQFDAQKATDIASLRQAYDQARSQLTSQTPGIEQAAQSGLNANDVYYYTQALPQLRAAMEAAGNYGGGEMYGQNANLIAMRGQNANEINLQKSNQLQAIADAVARLNAEQPLKEQELQSSLDAQALAASREAANTGIQNLLAVAGLTGSLGGTPTLEAQKFNADEAYRDWSKKFQENNATFQNAATDAATKAQILANEATTINLQYLPDQLKLELQKIKQDIDNGRLTTQAQLDEARARIKQIADNSAQGWAQINNQKAASTAAESLAQKVATIEADLNSPDPTTGYNGTAAEAYNELITNRDAYIADIGMVEYSKLLAKFKSQARL